MGIKRLVEEGRCLFGRGPAHLLDRFRRQKRKSRKGGRALVLRAAGTIRSCLVRVTSCNCCCAADLRCDWSPRRYATPLVGG